MTFTDRLLLLAARLLPPQSLSLGMAIATVALAGLVTLYALDTWSRYTEWQGVLQSDAPEAPMGLLDVGVAPDGRLIGVVNASNGPRGLLRVVTIDSANSYAELFPLVWPSLEVAPILSGHKRPRPIPPRYSLVDARLAAAGPRLATLWRGDSTSYLVIKDDRGHDSMQVETPLRVAISRDGGMVGLLRRTSSGSIAEVFRFPSAEKLLIVSLYREVTGIAISQGGRLALASDSGLVQVITPRSGRRLEESVAFHAPGAVTEMAFVNDLTLAAVGQFDGVRVLRKGAADLVAPSAGPLSGLAAADSGVTVWSPGGRINQYGVQQVSRTRWPIAVGLPLAANLVALLAVASYLQGRERRRSAWLRAGGSSLQRLTIPDPPEQLVESCAGGHCVLHAGDQLSAWCGYPPWSEFVENLVRWADEQKLLTPEFKASLLSALSAGEASSVADSVVSTALQHSRNTELQSFLGATFGPRRGLVVSRAHKALRDVGFSALVTPNLDDLLERTFDSQPLPVYTPEDGETLLNALGRRLFLVKLRGSLPRPPVLVTPSQYQGLFTTNLPFAEFTHQLYASKTILFIGSSLDQIAEFVQNQAISPQANVAQGPSLPRHFALVPVEREGWLVKAQNLKVRFGIEVLAYTPDSEGAAVAAFLQKLASMASERRAAGRASESEKKPFPGAIKRIELVNVGAFEKIEFDLDPKITILLGDNGVGKSTILRAVGLALAGSEQEGALAAGLIRSKPSDRTSEASRDTSAQITLETYGGKTYTTTIRRRPGEGALVQFQPFSWQRGEAQLALGLPPLRSVSQTPGASPQVLEDRPRPLPGDVLPIVTSVPDARVSDLKQWLINLDYRRRIPAAASKTERLLKDFFSSVTKLLDGVSIDFRGLTVTAGEVLVVTDDGPVPLHGLSQGTVSVIGLIGIILPRLYDVHGEAADEPRGEFAIILIDEIDAHMHPRWQQTLVKRLTDLFPKAQFLVTTHSPFIVAGRESGQIIRLRRDRKTKRIGAEPAYGDTKGADVASLLTGPLFDLETPSDPVTQELILKRRDLVANEHLTEAQKEQLRDLNKQLGGILVGPTADTEWNRYVRAVSQLDQVQANEESQQRPPADDKARLEAARQVLEQMRSQKERV